MFDYNENPFVYKDNSSEDKIKEEEEEVNSKREEEEEEEEDEEEDEEEESSDTGEDLEQVDHLSKELLAKKVVLNSNHKNMKINHRTTPSITEISSEEDGEKRYAEEENKRPKTNIIYKEEYLNVMKQQRKNLIKKTFSKGVNKNKLKHIPDNYKFNTKTGKFEKKNLDFNQLINREFNQTDKRDTNTKHDKLNKQIENKIKADPKNAKDIIQKETVAKVDIKARAEVLGINSNLSMTPPSKNMSALMTHSMNHINKMTNYNDTNFNMNKRKNTNSYCNSHHQKSNLQYVYDKNKSNSYYYRKKIHRHSDYSNSSNSSNQLYHHKNNNYYYRERSRSNHYNNNNTNRNQNEKTQTNNEKINHILCSNDIIKNQTNINKHNNNKQNNNKHNNNKHNNNKHNNNKHNNNKLLNCNKTTSNINTIKPNFSPPKQFLTPIKKINNETNSSIALKNMNPFAELCQKLSDQSNTINNTNFIGTKTNTSNSNTISPYSTSSLNSIAIKNNKSTNLNNSNTLPLPLLNTHKSDQKPKIKKQLNQSNKQSLPSKTSESKEEKIVQTISKNASPITTRLNILKEKTDLNQFLSQLSKKKSKVLEKIYIKSNLILKQERLSDIGLISNQISGEERKTYQYGFFYFLTLCNKYISFAKDNNNKIAIEPNENEWSISELKKSISLKTLIHTPLMMEMINNKRDKVKKISLLKIKKYLTRDIQYNKIVNKIKQYQDDAKNDGIIKTLLTKEQIDLLKEDYRMKIKVYVANHINLWIYYDQFTSKFQLNCEYLNYLTPESSDADDENESESKSEYSNGNKNENATKIVNKNLDEVGIEIPNKNENEIKIKNKVNDKTVIANIKKNKTEEENCQMDVEVNVKYNDNFNKSIGSISSLTSSDYSESSSNDSKDSSGLISEFTDVDRDDDSNENDS